MPVPRPHLARFVRVRERITRTRPVSKTTRNLPESGFCMGNPRRCAPTETASHDHHTDPAIPRRPPTAELIMIDTGRIAVSDRKPAPMQRRSNTMKATANRPEGVFAVALVCSLVAGKNDGVHAPARGVACVSLQVHDHVWSAQQP